MTKINLLFLIFIFNSCSLLQKTKNSTVDEKMQENYFLRLNQIYDNSGDSTNRAYYLNCHTGFENYLLYSNYLDGINKSSYFDLINKIAIDSLIPDLKNELGQDYYIFDECFYSPLGYIIDLGCYEFIIKDLNLVNRQDFRYKVYSLMLNENSQGSTLDCEDLKELIKIIPDKEFKKITYRKLLIKEIFIIMINK
ncbi:hypothetical protein ACE01N_20580 [Saccharicrinis sp. FJH2]|uniref:hypothetical protein n=1 Tax=Saccharicrinis sp. FJH65 TaxID=3344659 RepID=UPI0035F475B0